MEEEIRGIQTNGWGEKKNKNCTINIFCDDKKYDNVDDNRKNDGNCIINIFCNDIKNGNMCDCKKNNGHCIINIFCNDKQQDEKDW